MFSLGVHDVVGQRPLYFWATPRRHSAPRSGRRENFARNCVWPRRTCIHSPTTWRTHLLNIFGYICLTVCIAISIFSNFFHLIFRSLSQFFLFFLLFQTFLFRFIVFPLIFSLFLYVFFLPFILSFSFVFFHSFFPSFFLFLNYFSFFLPPADLLTSLSVHFYICECSSYNTVPPLLAWLNYVRLFTLKYFMLIFNGQLKSFLPKYVSVAQGNGALEVQANRTRSSQMWCL